MKSSNSVVYRERARQINNRGLENLNRDIRLPDISRFKREYEITRSLQRVNNVIRVYGIEPWQNSFMIVLEDIDDKR
jgi:serine/threonine protein kinase